VKRSFRPEEFKVGERGVHVPRLGKEKLMNEGASLRLIAEMTDIPVPMFCDEFEDDGAYCLVTRYVEGVKMTELETEQKKIVMEEIQVHLRTLQRLKSAAIGGPAGLVIPPHRTSTKTKNDVWILRPSTIAEYVFCHNDLSQQNIIVDPAALKIAAIIDWEFAGFYPAYFEMPLYKRLHGAPGSIPLGDEVDDTA
jgi:aminoglycoside phosphotransferase (APT) family kinase protein